MYMRIETNASRNNTGSDVRASFHMNAAVGAKFTALTRTIHFQMSDSLGSERISEYRVQQLHIHIANHFSLPPGPCKVLQRTGNLQYMVRRTIGIGALRPGRDLQRSQVGRRARQVDSRLNSAARWLITIARQIQIRRTRLDVVTLRPRGRRRNITQTAAKHLSPESRAAQTDSENRTRRRDPQCRACPAAPLHAPP
jgi:osmotically-inducible protein OsmY